MPNNNLLILIQARMGSARLPGKVLLDLCGVPMLLYMLDRLDRWMSETRLAGVERIGIATLVADTPEDRATLYPLLIRHGVPAVIASCDPNDVLARYAAVATQRPEFTYIVRVTGDCPVFDPSLIELLWHYWWGAYGGNTDYYTLSADWPDGLDCELFTREALLTAHAEVTDSADREHVTPYIWRHPERFQCETLACPYPLGDEKWSVDTEQDYAFVRAVVREMQRRYLGHLYGWRDVWALAREMAWRPRGNRNEAYLAQINSTKTWEEERYGAQSGQKQGVVETR